MKNIIRFLSLALVVVLTVAVFAACGKNESTPKTTGSSNDTKAVNDTKAADDTKGAEVSGEKKTCGNITVLVPADMKESNVDLFGKENPDYVSLSVNGQEMHQLRISIEDEETVTGSVDTTKEMNSDSNPVDVEFKTGDITWKGVAYVYAGTSDCFQIYGEIDGRFVLVGGSYFAWDDPITQSVLASIELAPAK